MGYQVQQRKLQSVTSRLNTMVVLVVGLLLSNLCLVGLVVFTTANQKTLVTPFMSESGFVVSPSAVDSQYLAMMSENFLYARLNVTPETVDANHERMYAFLSPKIYAAFVAELHREAVLIKTEKVTSSFAMISMHTNPKTLTSQITGIVTRSIGEERLPGVLATYTIRYHYSMGHLSMTEFTHTEGEAHE